MTFKALFYAYVLGGITFIPLLVAGIVFFTIYTSVPVGDYDVTKTLKGRMEAQSAGGDATNSDTEETQVLVMETNDIPRTRKGWLTMRRTFEEVSLDGGYVTMVRSFLDARSKDPKRSRPKDMWYVVLKGTVLYLYEDEEMTECEAAIELGGHDVVIFPEGLLDGELFAKRNAICLKPKRRDAEGAMPSITREMKLSGESLDAKVEKPTKSNHQEKDAERLVEAEKARQAAREEALDPTTPWFIFVRSNIEMEDWYLSLIHASNHPSKTPLLIPLQPVFLPIDMNYLVSTLDEQPDVIPTRWLNAIMGRLFFSYYKTHRLEAYIIGRLMKKLSKVKRPTFLTDIVVTEVSVGNKAPTLSKPMLKELTKEGDAAMEVHFHYKGEFRITIQATATIAIGTFKSYTVKLILAVVLKELEGNLLIKVKRPPSNRIWYAFTQTPRMILEVEPIVSDRQITWSMILSTIEARLKEIIQESVVMPNMDDIAFFDSLKYERRGGIWQDASRHEHPATPVLDSELAQNDDSKSTASAPLPDVLSYAVDEMPSSQTAHSDEELTHTQPPVSVSPEPSNDSNNVPVGEEFEPHPLDKKRRRSWFSTVRSEGSAARNSIPSDDDDEVTNVMQRGRSMEPDQDNFKALRSRSTPQKEESFQSDSGGRTPESDDSSLLNTYLAPQAVRRSSSQHSSKRDHAKSPSADSSKSAPDSTAPTATSRKTSANNTPSSPNSFLSTLKSKAGDKQALSNTAKEAMRKWGVNWGMRKDTNNDDVDQSSIGSTIGARLRPDNVASKARASYAEVRAAVAERKGRTAAGEGSLTDDGGDNSRSSSPVTSPVPVPEGRKSRAASHTSAGSSSYPESVALSTSATSTTSSNSKHPFGNDTSGSRKSSPAVSRTNTDGDVAMSNTPSKPIHVVQPTAKTMTIPGIHASHRGEIMSMGYSAPPQPTSMVSTEGKSSLYRLFKNSTSSTGSAASDYHDSQTLPSSSQQTTGQTSSISVHNTSVSALEPRADSTLAAIPSSPLVNSSSSPSTPHSPISPRVPPPLPPRSSPATAVSRSPLVPPLIRSTPPSPTAEEKLKSIATKDQRSRPLSFDNGPFSDESLKCVNKSPTVIANDTDGTPVTGAKNTQLTEPDHREPSANPMVSPSPKHPPPLPPRRIPVPEAQA